MTPSISTTLTTARRLGQVMCQNAFHPVAPSSAPASYNSSGMSCRPL